MTSEQQFGAKLRELRENKEWTLRRAAKAAGITHQRLAELEAGVARGTGKATRPSKDVVGRLARAYDVPKDFLLELAGYARERPLISDRDALLLDLFHLLSDGKQRLALGMLRLLAEDKPSAYGTEGATVTPPSDDTGKTRSQSE